MTDLLIIGKGPAGWSCAMTARMRGLTAAVAAPEEGGSLLASAEKVENYPGLPHCSGKELLARFREQALALGAEEISGLVRRVSPAGNSFYALCENDVLEAKAVLIATGAARPVLLPGEEELLGSGVSYCATCDGMFYRGKAVAVISGGDTGVKEAEFLAGIAGSVDFYRLSKGEKDPENAAVWNEKPLSLAREDGKIVLRTDAGDRPYDGVFLFRPAMPLHMLMPELETDGPFIRVNRKMETSVPGVFAAGDCTGKPFQAAKAAGEGNIAALSCAEYLRG